VGDRTDPLHDSAVGEDRPAVVEPHDSVAEQEPPLLGVGNYCGRGERVGGVGGGTGWFVLTHRLLTFVDGIDPVFVP